jgi:hypothetical protein
MQFQWDALLVETLFLAVILNIRPHVGIWLARLLVFRFMLLSGAVKLLSGDAAWRALTALEYHFETQPLPTVAAWYAHQLPHGLLRAGTAGTFVVELLLPFFIFLPRNVRFVALAGFVLLEVLILATGNYNFFNLLTLVLCVALLDDRALGGGDQRPRQRTPAGLVWRTVFAALAVLGILQIHVTLDRTSVQRWEIAVLGAVQPFQIANRYGLFAVMTTQRNELVVEASANGIQWRELPFRFKPQHLGAAPRWVAPYQPRLDWQMWFAALTTRQGAPWFDNFVIQLLRGAPAVKSLLAPSEFDNTPPRFVRVLTYRYHYTSRSERLADGAWWRREYLDVWYPPARLSDAGTGDN